MVQIPKPHELTAEERHKNDQLRASVGILRGVGLSMALWLMLGLIVAYLEGWIG